MILKFIHRVLPVLLVSMCMICGSRALAAEVRHSVPTPAAQGDCEPECEPDRRHRFSPEEYVKRCDAFITAEAKLTPAEAKKFFPLYHEMKNKQRECEFQKGKLERDAMKQMPNDEKCQHILNAINAINKHIGNLEESYQRKLLKVVSPSKLLSAKIAEKKFERRMLRNMMRSPRKD